jgi:hypothetical protein
MFVMWIRLPRTKNPTTPALSGDPTESSKKVRIRQYSKKWPAREGWFLAYLRRGDLPQSDRTVIQSNVQTSNP